MATVLIAMARSRARLRALLLTGLCCSLAGCPCEIFGHGDGDDPSDAGGAGTGALPDAGGAGAPSLPRYGVLVSIQEQQIANAPELGHGLSVVIQVAPARVPIYDDAPGQPTGCKVWLYDMQDDPPPPDTDQGVIAVHGVRGGSLACAYEVGRGYVCPTATGSGSTVVAPLEASRARYTVVGHAFTEADLGRYLRVRGAANAANDGEFPIVLVESLGRLQVVNPAAVEETFDSTYAVLAGAGPAPVEQIDAFAMSRGVRVAIEPGGEGRLDFAEIGPVVPGSAVALDAPSRSLLTALPVDGSSVQFACAGEGGACGEAMATVLRISTTDADITGARRFALPRARDKQLEIQCATLDGDGTMTLSEPVLELLRSTNESSPITRVRTAYMRDGVGLAMNTSPDATGSVTVLAGHQLLGFTTR